MCEGRGRGGRQQPVSTNAESHVYARLLYTAMECNRSPAAASVSVPSLQLAFPASPHPPHISAAPHLQRAVVRVDAVAGVVHSEIGQRCHHERQLRGQETDFWAAASRQGVEAAHSSGLDTHGHASPAAFPAAQLFSCRLRTCGTSASTHHISRVVWRRRLSAHTCRRRRRTSFSRNAVCGAS